MILLIFAFFALLVWYYLEHSFQDDISKAAVIPGLKALLLTFAFIILLTDCFIFVETNRLIAAQASGANSTCLSYTGSSISYPAAMSVVDGSAISGNLDSLKFLDGNYEHIIEVGADPGASLYVNYTSVPSFSRLHFAGRTTGSATGYHVDMYDTLIGWHTVYAFANSTGMLVNDATMNGSKYISNGTVQARVFATGTGNPSDYLDVDWLVLDGNMSYTAYCTDGMDTQYIFIYHKMEGDIMVLLLGYLPYGALLIGTMIFIQLLMVMVPFINGKKNEGPK